jgi:choline dehydrogenase
MNAYDYIVVGAGSAGCVLANRLSADPAVTVLLLEAGPADRHPFIHMPKGLGKTLADPSLAWQYRTQRDSGNAARPEVWLRGKTLGGSSSVNGMIYVRGQPEDYDHWAALGNRGWSWADIAPCFQQMEDHHLGADELRGSGGPLHVSSHPMRNPVCRALIDAGVQMGLREKPDLNRLDPEGIGYTQLTIRNGRRASAARSFLDPVRQRPNLDIRTGALAERVIMQGKRAVGVLARIDGVQVEWRAHGEVIVAAGAVESPKLLQLSGIGPAAYLQRFGIDVVHDSAGVGGNMREHFLLALQYRIAPPQLSYNRQFSGLPLLKNVMQYALLRSGVMSTGSHEVAAFVKTDPALDLPDAQLMLTPTSRDFSGTRIALEKEAGIQLFGYALRPESEGSVMIASPDPSAAPVITPSYLSARYDREVSVRTVRYMRTLLRQSALQPYLREETRPGTAVESDEDILAAYHRYGQSGFDAGGTCKIGNDRLAVVDERLRVRGVRGLRVMDCSILPTMVSGATNGPMMAMAWRAADLINEDRKARAA